MIAVDPLRAICLEDEEGYRDSLAKVSSRLVKSSATEIWRNPLGNAGLTRVLVRWLEIDALEARGCLTSDQIAVLRAEALAAFARSERSAEAGRWVDRFLDGVSDRCSAECRARADRVRQRSSAKPPST